VDTSDAIAALEKHKYVLDLIKKKIEEGSEKKKVF